MTEGIEELYPPRTLIKLSDKEAIDLRLAVRQMEEHLRKTNHSRANDFSDLRHKLIQGDHADIVIPAQDRK